MLSGRAQNWILTKLLLIFDHSVEKFDELFIVLLLVPIITTNVLDFQVICDVTAGAWGKKF